MWTASGAKQLSPAARRSTPHAVTVAAVIAALQCARLRLLATLLLLLLLLTTTMMLTPS